MGNGAHDPCTLVSGGAGGHGHPAPPHRCMRKCHPMRRDLSLTPGGPQPSYLVITPKAIGNLPSSLKKATVTINFVSWFRTWACESMELSLHPTVSVTAFQQWLSSLANKGMRKTLGCGFAF